MNIQGAFPSKYLKAADLGAARPVVTIQSVRMEEVGDDRLPVLSMVGKEKGLILNRTNANMIEEIAGTNETDHWHGVKIQLYATKTDYAGKRVDCIRIEAPTVPNTRPAFVPPPLAPVPPPVVSRFQDVDGAAVAESLTDADIPF